MKRAFEKTLPLKERERIRKEKMEAERAKKEEEKARKAAEKAKAEEVSLTSAFLRPSRPYFCFWLHASTFFFELPVM